MLAATKIRPLIYRRFTNIAHEKCFITTPIFYANGSPHIGHLYSAAIADAAYRFNQLIYFPQRSILSTGTDEHGIKIKQAANKSSSSISEYCDEISAQYRKLFSLAKIEFTDFVRTTEERHKKSVEHFWDELNKRGHIESSFYSGWYCISDETFLTENQVGLCNGKCISIESGHPVEWVEEINYIFLLSKLQEEIIYWVEKRSNIKPKHFKRILLNYLKDPLPNLSISRPKTRINWGLSVPDDKSQTIYVWLDALVNYLTVCGYPNEEYKSYWPPTLQILGKDILKFHGIYWPGFLIAAGLEPTKNLLVHSHWTVNGEKMSKSKGNVVDPIEKSELYTMEGLRYFLLREGVPQNDGNYSDVKVLRILNSELADTLGNLLSRTCAKSLNPRQIFPRISRTHFENISKIESTKYLLQIIANLPDKCCRYYDSHSFYLVITNVMTALHAANSFFDSCKPWEYKSSNDMCMNADNDLKLETIIAISMETLRICAIILQPIIPHLSKILLNKLNVNSSERQWCHLKVNLWTHLDKNIERNLGQGKPILFKRINNESTDPKLSKISVKVT